MCVSGITGSMMKVIANSTSAERSSGQVMRATQPWISARAARMPVARDRRGRRHPQVAGLTA